jgi:hypothetical protein
MPKRRMKGGDERDAFTRWRHYLHWRPGERKAIKARANRRERRTERQRLADDNRRGEQ